MLSGNYGYKKIIIIAMFTITTSTISYQHTVLSKKRIVKHILLNALLGGITGSAIGTMSGMLFDKPTKWKEVGNNTITIYLGETTYALQGFFIGAGIGAIIGSTIGVTQLLIDPSYYI